MPPVEEQKPTKVIRNTSLAELEKMKAAKATPAKTESQATSEMKVNAPEMSQDTSTKPRLLMKPKSSIFEPEPQLVKLPSRNIYISPDLAPNGSIYVRRMTAIEENMWYKNLVGKTITMQSVDMVINEVLNSCIKSNINAMDLSLIDKLPVLFKIFHLTYGEIEIKVKCQSGLHDDEYPIRFAFEKDPAYTYIPDDYIYPAKIILESFPNAAVDWYIMYPTIAQQMKFYDADLISVRRMLTHHMNGIIVEDGKEREITENDYEGVITNLNKADTDKYQSFLRDFGAYGVELTFKKVACKEKSCPFYDAPQQLDLPIEELFRNIIQLQNK